MTPQIPPTLLSSNALTFPECFPSLNGQLVRYCLVQEPQTFKTAVETCADLGMQLIQLETQNEQAGLKNSLTQLSHEPWDVTIWAMGDSVEHPLMWAYPCH